MGEAVGDQPAWCTGSITIFGSGSEVFRVMAMQDSGSTLALLPSQGPSNFSIQRIQ